MRLRPPQQHGFSYIEVLIAVAVIGLMLYPVTQSFQTSLKSSEIQQNLSTTDSGVRSKMETLMAESFGALLEEARTTASPDVASTTYSDATGIPNRVLVYLSIYNAEDPSDPFTILDLNLDLDGDPYTGDSADMLWLKVAAENTPFTLESLRLR